MKTFEYLDSLVETLLLLENIKPAILNWRDGYHEEAQNKYDNFLHLYDIEEGTMEEDYIFWKCSNTFTKHHNNRVAEAVRRLEEIGYVP